MRTVSFTKTTGAWMKVGSDRCNHKSNYSNGTERMEWNRILNPGDVVVISKDGMVSINGGRSGNISCMVPEADAGKNKFIYIYLD